MIGSAPKPARREEEAQFSATILPFRLRASRAETPETTAAPAVELHGKLRTSKAKKESEEIASLPAAERLSILPPRYRGWLQQALIAALLLHLGAFAIMHMSFVSDVQRAANSGGNTSDGTTVLDIEIVAEAKLPAAKTATNMTAPDATKQTATPPQVKQEEKLEDAKKPEAAPNPADQFALPKEELAAPNKADTADKPQSPNQEKAEPLEAQKKTVVQPKAEPKKKKQEQADPSIAAAPNRAAGNRTNNANAGANGSVPNGGQADTSSYNAMVLAHLQRYRVYPEQARASRVTGVSTVRFTLGAGGNVISVSLAGSSGTGMLDQAALAMVQRASPFPPIPPSLGRASMTFAAPVRFNLR